MNVNYKLIILAIGIFLALPASVFAAPGDLDATFGSGGIVTTDFPPRRSLATDVAVQADGKIVIVGYLDFQQPNGPIVLTRYNANGSLDDSFGNGGKTTVTIMHAHNLSAIAIQADGKIVVAGTVAYDHDEFLVARFETNGALDTSFGWGGIVYVDFGNDDGASDIAIQPDGKIVIVGWSGGDKCAVARLNSDGSLDESFGSFGRVITNLGRSASAVALQPNGRIIVAGSYSSSPFNDDFALVRYNADGSLDASFDDDGIAITPVGDGQDFAYDVAVQSDGKIVLAGSAAISVTGGFENDFAVVRYNANGSLDSSFDGDGKVTTSFFNSDSASSVALQTNGKIVIAGSSEDNDMNIHSVLVRYNPNGSLDASFGNGGATGTNLFADEYFVGLAIQPDGKIVAAGQSGFEGDVMVARFLGESIVSNRKLFDFDGDGKADISVFRPTDRTWYLNRSSQGFSALQFGLSNDKITPVDFDGDGKTDIAVYRDGVWYLLRSTAGFAAIQFGLADDVPQPSDFDGDGRAELAVYRGGVWFTLNLNNNQFNAVQFGLAADKPVAADYDGDGRADYAVYREGVWYLLQSTQGFAAIQFGLASDKPVSADYDGDGKTDVAVYRGGFWYLLGSQTGLTAFQFGLASDIPAPADYDGDGRTDAAVFRNGTWYLRQSANGFSATQFGLTSDKPVPSAYLP